MKSRYWWAPAQYEDFQHANFIWTSWKKDEHMQFLKSNKNQVDRPVKIYNRIQNNKQLTNKKGVFINMREYYNAVGIDPFSILPMTFLVKSTHDEEFKKFESEYKRYN